MKVIKICPVCSNPAIEVPFETVSNLLKLEAMKSQLDSKEKYWVCTSPVCYVTYFCKTATFSAGDIKVPFWFKNHDVDIPICYCSKLTRAEITDAVKHGCATIDEVQAYTKKNITGNCLRENPLGNCCREVFLFTMGKLTEPTQSKP
jgi:bacterioferritin-associated ferredoxin